MVWRTTGSADEDIIALETYGTVRYGRRQAKTYVDELFDCLGLLAANPYIARERREVTPLVRLFRFRSHHILYLVDSEDVVILRVLSNRQDWLHPV